MDGKQSPVASSLRFRLALWLSVAVIVVAACAGTVLFRLALAEAHTMQDNQLRQTGYLISRLDAVPYAPMAREQPGDVDFDARVVVRFLRAPGGPEIAPPPRPPEFSSAMADGLQTVYVGREQWRVFVKTNARKVRVAVGQQTRIRDATARANAIRTVMPMLFLAPVLVLLVTVLVERMFKPLKTLAAELGRRKEHDLGQLSAAGLPTEVWPLVAQINALLNRTARTLALQRRFIADAAHELRSPMTAMSLQAERLGATEMPAEARTRLGALIAGLRRTRALLEQLLTLARSHEPTAKQAGQVPLEQVIREVLEDLMPLAEEKHIDLGVIGDIAATVAGNHFDVKVLVKNLVDNAIRYTPNGGRVDVSVRSGHAGVTLQIDDTGPGIPLEERGRVFDSFYRVLGNGEIGSGLGLAIARTVAENIGARIELSEASEQRGLRVLVAFAPVLPGAGGEGQG
jgi:two-component system OmpR family sensor kinase